MQSPARRLTPKEEDRLNEAAKARVAKLLGVKRNMIDLTDSEPPRKMARHDETTGRESSHGGAQTPHLQAPTTAKPPAPQHSPSRGSSRPQSMSSPRLANHFSSFPGTRQDQNTRQEANASANPQPSSATFTSQSTMQMSAPPGQNPAAHQRPTQYQNYPQQAPAQVPAQNAAPFGSMPTPRGSVSYQSPHQRTTSYGSGPPAPAPGPNMPAPQYMELAHPADLLSNISLSVASLENFQLQEILATAALRHPDVLDLLRTQFSQKETDRATAHQALYDRLLNQSQEQARIVRSQNGRLRTGSVPSPYAAPMTATAGAQQTHPPAHAYAAPPAQTAQAATMPPTKPSRPVFRTPPAAAVLSAPQPVPQPGIHTYESQVPGVVKRLQEAINRLANSVTLKNFSAAKYNALQNLCNMGLEAATSSSDTETKSALKADTALVAVCQRIYNSLDEDSKLGIRQPAGLLEKLEDLQNKRGDCFDGFGGFMKLLGKREFMFGGKV